jgi:hypothetical protein
VSLGQRPSIKIGSDGPPLISYYDLTNKNLKVVHCADAACTRPLTAGFLR